MSPSFSGFSLLPIENEIIPMEIIPPTITPVRKLFMFTTWDRK